MSLIAFQLGRKRALCLAELKSLFGDDAFFDKTKEVAIFDIDEPTDPQALQNRLGGTIKVIRIIEETKNFEKSINAQLETLADASGKIPFAINTFNFSRTNGPNIRKLLSSGKKVLRNLGFNCRFVNNGPRNPMPAAIYKSKTIEKGLDLNLIRTDRAIYLGQTIAIQDINSYSKRDFDKPARDARVGMLPPKLAQIMINLAGPDLTTLYDPFCGTGTVLTEAMLMPHLRAVVGSDIEDRMVDFSQQNCSWLTKEFPTKTPFFLFTRDAKFINTQSVEKAGFKASPDAIVTEGYLGTPVTELPSEDQRDITFRDLANLHLNWLRAARQLTDGPIVTCIAAFRTEKGFHHLPRLKELVETAGYKIQAQYTYDRPDQIVARDILVLRKA